MEGWVNAQAVLPSSQGKPQGPRGRLNIHVRVPHGLKTPCIVYSPEGFGEERLLRPPGLATRNRQKTPPARTNCRRNLTEMGTCEKNRGFLEKSAQDEVLSTDE